MKVRDLDPIERAMLIAAIEAAEIRRTRRGPGPDGEVDSTYANVDTPRARGRETRGTSEGHTR